MSSTGSVTHWVSLLKAGDRAAAQPLWDRYFRRLVGFARQRLAAAPRRAADEEDVALSAFDCVCRQAEAGRWPQLADRNDLWRLLVVVTARKALDLVRREQALKRRAPAARQGGDLDLEQVLGNEPTPEFAAQVAEECWRLLERLPDADLRAVALWKMEGHTNEEVAARLGCVPRTVERRVRVIRTLWSRDDV